MHKMIAYRLLQFPMILAVIYLITFMLCWVAPGDPFTTEKNLDPAVQENLRKQFHADSPAQFLAYYPWQIIRHGDLGSSMRYREWSINDIVGQSLPVSVTLGMFALVVGVVAGVGLGTLAAVHRGGVYDWLSLSLALIGISLPSFVVAAVELMAASQ